MVTLYTYLIPVYAGIIILFIVKILPLINKVINSTVPVAHDVVEPSNTVQEVGQKQALGTISTAHAVLDESIFESNSFKEIVAQLRHESKKALEEAIKQHAETLNTEGGIQFTQIIEHPEAPVPSKIEVKLYGEKLNSSSDIVADSFTVSKRTKPRHRPSSWRK